MGCRNWLVQDIAKRSLGERHVFHSPSRVFHSPIGMFSRRQEDAVESEDASGAESEDISGAESGAASDAGQQLNAAAAKDNNRSSLFKGSHTDQKQQRIQQAKAQLHKCVERLQKELPQDTHC